MSDLFAYDRGASLDVRGFGSWQDEGVTVHDVGYASPRGGRVPAFVIVPDGDGPFAGLIVDLRRAVDLLRARGIVDGARIAYLGISYGAAMGGLLAGSSIG